MCDMIRRKKNLKAKQFHMNTFYKMNTCKTTGWALL